MIAIFKREMKNYFSSAIGYIFLAVFYLFASFFFIYGNLVGSTANMSGVFGGVVTIFIFLIPILTMRLMCEDKRQKTDQLLLTSPVNLFGITFGKFLAALSVYAMAIAVTALYAFTLAIFVNVDTFSILGNIVGLLLMGGAFIGIGLFISSLTENQVISAVVSMFIIFTLYLMDTLSSAVTNAFVVKIFSFLSVYSRYTNFSLGIFNLGDALYYVSVAAIFLFLTVRMLEKRRWS